MPHLEMLVGSPSIHNCSAAMYRDELGLGRRRWDLQTVANKGNLESAKAQAEKASKRTNDTTAQITGFGTNTFLKRGKELIISLAP
jgi:hypothetical protein